MVDTPSTPADRLKLARVRVGYREAKHAADAHGWNYDTYKTHENGYREITPKRAAIYAKAFGVSAAWLLTGEAAGAPLDPVLTRIPIRVVPMLELVSIQELLDVKHGGRPNGITEVPVEIGDDLTPRSFAVLVDGTSMVGPGDGSLRPGDVVIIAPERDPEPGDIVLAIVGNQAMLRKYRPASHGDLPSEFALVPLNEDYPTVRTSIDAGSIIVGRAIRHSRRL